MELVEMGFDEIDVIRALEINGSNYQLALDWLLSKQFEDNLNKSRSVSSQKTSHHTSLIRKKESTIPTSIQNFEYEHLNPSEMQRLIMSPIHQTNELCVSILSHSPSPTSPFFRFHPDGALPFQNVRQSISSIMELTDNLSRQMNFLLSESATSIFEFKKCISLYQQNNQLLSTDMDSKFSKLLTDVKQRLLKLKNIMDNKIYPDLLTNVIKTISECKKIGSKHLNAQNMIREESRKMRNQVNRKLNEQSEFKNLLNKELKSSEFQQLQHFEEENEKTTTKMTLLALIEELQKDKDEIEKEMKLNQESYRQQLEVLQEEEKKRITSQSNPNNANVVQQSHHYHELHRQKMSNCENRLNQTIQQINEAKAQIQSIESFICGNNKATSKLRLELEHMKTRINTCESSEEEYVKRLSTIELENKQIEQQWVESLSGYGFPATQTGQDRCYEWLNKIEKVYNLQLKLSAHCSNWKILFEYILDKFELGQKLYLCSSNHSDSSDEQLQNISPADVCDWIQSLGYEFYPCSMIFRKHKVNGYRLFKITLKQMVKYFSIDESIANKVLDERNKARDFFQTRSMNMEIQSSLKTLESAVIPISLILETGN